MRYYEICISKWCQRLSPFLEDHVKPWRREGLASCKLVQNRLNLSPKDAQKLNRSVAYFAIFLVSFSPFAARRRNLFLRAASSLGLIHQDLSLRLKRKKQTGDSKGADGHCRAKPKHPLLESHGALGASGSGLAGGSQDGSGCTQTADSRGGRLASTQGLGGGRS